ncbi:CaiB/BaiF CoA transferase family protein [Nocardia rhamnosiphila]|uniref:CoA transferase n=1 Tax=Nocardia rhamnosiphila TaxID=426716 RepID=A0ABV2WRD9_9NOCA
MTDQYRSRPPLDGVRVIDQTIGVAATATRLLAELGAEVVRVEPAGEPPLRRPAVDGTSIFDVIHQAGKYSIALSDSIEDRELYKRLISHADILVRDLPGPRGATAEALLCLNPGLVVAEISDFGLSGPYREWKAPEWVLQALSGVLANSGAPGEMPLFAPGTVISESAATQAAWPILVAYWNRLRNGIGDVVDISLFESALQAVDPGFGIAGSAAMGVPSSDGPRDRPDVAFRYPIFPCRDGLVRICLLSVRQWHGMRRWLGDPEEFLDQAFDNMRTRFAARDRLYPLIANLFSRFTTDELTAKGHELGVPIQGILALDDVLNSEHYESRGVFAHVPLAGGSRVARVVRGAIEIDGRRMSFERAAPEPGSDSQRVREIVEGEPLVGVSENKTYSAARPFAGLRVLDLGVIVVGAELGRLFADQGADVVKVETRAFPDGSRASAPDSVSPTFAWGHRNKRSLGLNLRSEAGIAHFLKLVSQSDVVLSNFKPGTMESLGLGIERLRSANPEVVVVESSALGSRGPWSQRMGYGPLVRAATGLTGVWRSDVEGSLPGDAATIYPDHIAARVCGVAALAALIGRRRGIEVTAVHVAQSEVVLGHLADVLVLESVECGAGAAWARRGGGGAPAGLYACAGEDEWCAITVREEAEWHSLCEVIGRPDLLSDRRFEDPTRRWQNHAALDKAIEEWTSGMHPRAAMTRLQQAGVPAGMMLRHAEQPDDPQLRERSYFGHLPQPQIDGGLITEKRPAIFQRVPAPPLAPAPIHGEHTREIAGELLGLLPEQIEEQIATGVLEVPA